MDFLGDFGLYLIRALALLGEWMGELTSPVPWPLVFVFIALPILSTMRFVVWFLRGTTWPVRCKYPFTTKRSDGDRACRAQVVGEWRYCRDHNRPRRLSNGHSVRPDLPRWKTIVDGNEIDRRDAKGASKRTSLLFHRGFARSPRQVWLAMPDLWSEWGHAARSAGGAMRLIPRETVPVSAVATRAPGPTLEEQIKYRAVSEQAERADQVLHVLRISIPLALLSTAVSAFLDGPRAAIVEYSALLLLGLSVEVLRQGLRTSATDGDWVPAVVKSTVRRTFLLALVALVLKAADDYAVPFLESFVASQG